MYVLLLSSLLTGRWLRVISLLFCSGCMKFTVPLHGFNWNSVLYDFRGVGGRHQLTRIGEWVTTIFSSSGIEGAREITDWQRWNFDEGQRQLLIYLILFSSLEMSSGELTTTGRKCFCCFYTVAWKLPSSVLSEPKPRLLPSHPSNHMPYQSKAAAAAAAFFIYFYY